MSHKEDTHMPLTELQKLILKLLAQNRSPDSYVGGASVIHRSPLSPRFSEDLDLFHDSEDSVAKSAEFDAVVLRKNGLKVEWIFQKPTFFRAVVSKRGETFRLEWAFDSAFRFFPVEKDEVYGYRLHMADAATNKVLALAGRTEVRDFVDVLHLDETYLSLGALCWAACGKDPGFTPEFLLEEMNRHARFTQHDIQRLALSYPIHLRDLKKQWIAAVERARNMATVLPADSLGCLYLNADGIPVSPDPAQDEFASLHCHFGRTGGAWPTFVK